MLPPENNSRMRESVFTSTFDIVPGVLVCLLTSLFQNKSERKKSEKEKAFRLEMKK